MPEPKPVQLPGTEPQVGNPPPHTPQSGGNPVGQQDGTFNAPSGRPAPVITSDAAAKIAIAEASAAKAVADKKAADEAVAQEAKDKVASDKADAAAKAADAKLAADKAAADRAKTPPPPVKPAA